MTLFICPFNTGMHIVFFRLIETLPKTFSTSFNLLPLVSLLTVTEEAALKVYIASSG